MPRGLSKAPGGKGIWLAMLAALAISLSIIIASAIAAKPAEAAATSRSIEAEKMRGSGKVFLDRTASNNRAKVHYRNGAASTRVRGQIRYIAVRARGDRCGKAPRMKVMVDGKRVMVRSVKNQKKWRYYATRVRTSGGIHRVKVIFTNDRKTRKCDRNLRVDKVHLRLASRPAPTPAPTQPRPIALGVLVDGGSGAGIDRYTKLTGKAPAHVMFFRNWEQNEFPNDNLNNVVSRNAMPIVTWVPKDPALGVEQPEYALRSIASGKHDAYIRQWAKDAKAWGKPFYLRPMHEMNGTWSPWGQNVNGNTPTDFIKAWRHMHNIFEQEGATNVRWVWSPNAGGRKFTDLYPGDAYVDWVALDGYNWGTSRSNSGWRSIGEVFAPHYKTLAAMTNKPMMLAETATAEVGGDKAAWIRRGFLRELPYQFPRVRAVVWFDKDKEADWRVNSSSASLDAYKRVAGSSLYEGRLR